MLLNFGVNPNQSFANGETPLFFAAKDRDNNIVELLLNHGADPNIPNQEGNTPLDIAVRLRNDNIIQLLREYVEKNTQKKFIEEVLKYFDHENGSDDEDSDAGSNATIYPSGDEDSSGSTDSSSPSAVAADYSDAFTSSPLAAAADSSDSSSNLNIDNPAIPFAGTTILPNSSSTEALNLPSLSHTFNMFGHFQHHTDI